MSLKPYVIGETAYNHEGDIEYLFRMIDDIAELKLNAIKLHMTLKPESYMNTTHPVFKELKKWIFSEEQWDEIIDRVSKKGLDIIILCNDVKGVEYLLNKKKAIHSMELHAVSLNDYYLLDIVSKFNGRIILGIGGSTLDEIEYAITFLKSRGVEDILLMYGFQSYPTNYKEINLSQMAKVRQLFNLPVGYADHTGFDDPHNELISIMAAVMGFNILEKHYTPEFGKERIDYQAAVGKEKMKNIVNLMQLAFDVHGDGSLEMSTDERNYGNIGPMKKAIVAKRDIKKGEKLSIENLWFKRTQEESYIKQSQFPLLIGLKTKVDINKDEIIDFSKIQYEFKKSAPEEFFLVGKKE